MKEINSLTFILLLMFTMAFSKPDVAGDFIFPLQDKHVHSSSIIECPNGDLLVCWFYGSGERKADDVLVQGARLKKGSDKWSPVFTMADSPELPDCNPVLFVDQKERLWMFWIAVIAHGWENSILKYRVSEDYQGQGAPKWSWQDIIVLQPGEKFANVVGNSLDKLEVVEPMWAEYAPTYTSMIKKAALDPRKRQTGWMTRTHPTVLPSGRILLPLYSDGFNVSLAAISDDIGDHWRASLPMVGFGPIQPTIVRKNDGTLVSFMRDSGDAPYRVLKSISTDDGESWSIATDTDIPNPGSSLEVISLKNGLWLMVFNDTEDGRHRLALALSDDEGNNWKWKRILEFAEPGQKSFAYPSIIQTRDGVIHLTYSYKENNKSTIKHVALDAAWIIKE